MATEQEREAVAIEVVKHCAGTLNLDPSLVFDSTEDEDLEMLLALADAAIALRDKALKDAAARVRGLKKPHYSGCAKTRTDTSTGLCICGLQHQIHNAAIEDAAREVERG